ncbi:hypothetical protein, partial [Burkholderia cenocepacia]|uniref:hypothetical protein n=1 Tax=Burkholderia cenocepacia TaxID=95486 RepID=UPI001C4DF5A8
RHTKNLTGPSHADQRTFVVGTLAVRRFGRIRNEVSSGVATANVNARSGMVSSSPEAYPL